MNVVCVLCDPATVSCYKCVHINSDYPFVQPYNGQWTWMNISSDRIAYFYVILASYRLLEYEMRPMLLSSENFEWRTKFIRKRYNNDEHSMVSLTITNWDYNFWIEITINKSHCCSNATMCPETVVAFQINYILMQFTTFWLKFMNGDNCVLNYVFASILDSIRRSSMDIFIINWFDVALAFGQIPYFIICVAIVIQRFELNVRIPTWPFWMFEF